MLFILAILLSIAIALLRGGRFERLADVPIRCGPLILLGFLIQILIFTPILGPYLSQTQTIVAYNLSMLLIWATMALNWRLPGAPLVALGVFLNWFAITINGGFMPASPDSLISAGLEDRAALAEGENLNNTILVNPNTRLPFLTDVMAVPSPFPFSTVFSLGDLVLAAGAALLIYRTMLTPSTPTPVPTP